MLRLERCRIVVCESRNSFFFRWDKMLVDVDVIRDAIRNKRIEFGRIQM